MSIKVICPRCGTENRADAMNCVACRINLKFAQENPAEIERLRQADATRQPSARDFNGVPNANLGSIWLPGLLLLGSFIFAFCLGESVHEFGHFLINRLYGIPAVIQLDPFGGSRTLVFSAASPELRGMTSLGGPLLNLFAGLTCMLLLWKKRKPAILPFLLWGPISLVQEGVTFTLGILTPGGDAQLIADWRIPAAVIIGFGVLFLISGIGLMCWLLPLVNLSPQDSFIRKLAIVTGGMVSFMFIRLFISGIFAPHLALENTIPLIFSLLLATVVVLLYGPLYSILGRLSDTQLAPVSRSAATMPTVMAMGIVLFQLLTFN